ncbi:MAG: hypothetical protein KDK70_00895 [Myxococcales bacterium]|nr:hypothetical protein [Myxococcales bacterium]
MNLRDLAEAVSSLLERKGPSPVQVRRVRAKLELLIESLEVPMDEAEASSSLDHLESRLDDVLGRLGMLYRTEDSAPPEVVDLIKAGRRTEAVTTYRKVTGADLEEALGVVRAIKRGDGSA